MYEEFVIFQKPSPRVEFMNPHLGLGIQEDLKKDESYFQVFGT